MTAIHTKPGQRVRVVQPESSYRSPDGLNAGDEVVVLPPGYHQGGYPVEKNGVVYRVPFSCVEHQHIYERSYREPSQQKSNATRGMREHG